MQSDKFLRMLGLAKRAGGVVFGEGAVRDGIRDGSAELVVVSQDAAENTKKKIRDNCSFYNIKYVELYSRYDLGKACGKEFAVVLAVKNTSIADSLIKIIGE